ncbi:MAG: type II toxin-antitoxin system RelE/ParE family toxin [Firmicutes bacterium]|nr:type II toxin-antitoxin system RelE/ParE family toxin [Bacillota bacterium]
MLKAIFLPPAAKYLKKLKDKKLKELYKEAIKKVCEDPYVGEAKKGDLEGTYGYDIYYNRTNYELAYTIERCEMTNSDETELIVVIMAGTRENFYEELKRYLRS